MQVGVWLPKLHRVPGLLVDDHAVVRERERLHLFQPVWLIR